MESESVQLTAERFEAVAGGRFTVEGTSFAFELVRVERRDASKARPFSLIFRAPGPGALEQRTYQLENDTLGSLPIFLVPVARAGHQVEYEAVFN